MSDIFGKAIKVSIFGESHGSYVGCTLDGLPAGIKIDYDFISQQMNKRKAKSKLTTTRLEADEVEIISGVYEGYSTGSSITILIANKNIQEQDYTDILMKARPSHADYSNEMKYLGYQNPLGGGHSSGRLSAPLVAVGAIAQLILKEKGIAIESHILKCHHIKDESFYDHDIMDAFQVLQHKEFPTISNQIEKEMKDCIEQAVQQKDSVGGIIETAIIGLEAGLGEPWFDSIESCLSHLLFSVPAVKGVSFGTGFDMSNYYGSEVKDEFYVEKNRIMTKTNHNGGINGGISNGMPIIINTAIKPTPSFFQDMQTVNFKTKEETTLTLYGRHDPAIIYRANVVITSIVAIGILDLYMQLQAKLAIQSKHKESR